jgi:hypothetical protein
MACGVVAPFAATPLPRIDSFIPVILAIIFVADLVTAVLLLSQLAARALLVLANGYLFSALIVIPHALTFPGAFAPEGLLGAGVQSSGWLNVFWHFGFLKAIRRSLDTPVRTRSTCAPHKSRVDLSGCGLYHVRSEKTWRRSSSSR